MLMPVEYISVTDKESVTFQSQTPATMASVIRSERGLHTTSGSPGGEYRGWRSGLV